MELSRSTTRIVPRLLKEKGIVPVQQTGKRSVK